MKFEGVVPAPKKPVATAVSGTNGHWRFPEQMGPPYVGFIYVIYDTVLHRAYLGKKFYVGNGVKNKGVDSGWRKYKGSSDTLKEIFRHRPIDEFEFYCVEQYKARGALAYAETWTLCHVEAPTTKYWYNTRIEAISWPVKEGITDRHKAMIDTIEDRIATAIVKELCLD